MMALPDSLDPAQPRLQREDATGKNPRWVKTLGLGAIVVVLVVFIVILLIGHQIPSHGP